MLRHIINTTSIFNKIVQQNAALFVVPIGQSITNIQQHRHAYRTTKHWNPKWKKLRALKVVKIELPNYNEDDDDISEEAARAKLKERGLLPVRQWDDRQIFIASTGGIFEPYVPPEGDGKFSAISKVGAKQKFEFLEKKGKSMWSVRKIKSFDSDFHQADFPDQAKDIYIKAHESLAKKDKDELIKYVTEKAYPIMLHNIEDKQLVWKFVESLEAPRLVHARCTKVLTEDDVFAQVTIRFHTKQILAVYDRFGRLIQGSEHLEKDVLEYIIFERHLANEYGTWRIHDKIVPTWMPPKQATSKTYILPKEVVEEEEEPVVSAMQPLEEAKTLNQV